MKTNDNRIDIGFVRGAPLVWLRLEGLLFFILSIILYSRTGASWWRFGLLLLTPDISFAGYYLNARWGAAVYNVVIVTPFQRR
jgi:hypothetical protein